MRKRYLVRRPGRRETAVIPGPTVLIPARNWLLRRLNTVSRTLKVISSSPIGNSRGTFSELSLAQGCSLELSKSQLVQEKVSRQLRTRHSCEYAQIVNQSTQTTQTKWRNAGPVSH